MMVACLVNTYDKLKLHEIHLRTIARAAPLCYAYDFHLALFDFNFWKEKGELVRDVMDYTTIGEGGRYLKMLEEEGRLHLISKVPSHFGEIIATTSKPENNILSLEDIRKLKSACFLIGLGRKGLPKDLIKRARYNLDVTFRGVSLETCSAIGAILALVWVVRYGRR
ncbi:DUF531 family protein [Geoglobus acetivorans]|uniref:DUF531 domain-containing protein n=1 Tax=Geoglobus acetivorans TaxID=565033 RepID=A0ABZ3H4H1_GEOAI|nr:DUF531 family protein [Geoglobus acetivorans]